MIRIKRHDQPLKEEFCQNQSTQQIAEKSTDTEQIGKNFASLDLNEDTLVHSKYFADANQEENIEAKIEPQKKKNKKKRTKRRKKDIGMTSNTKYNNFSQDQFVNYRNYSTSFTPCPSFRSRMASQMQFTAWPSDIYFEEQIWASGASCDNYQHFCEPINLLENSVTNVYSSNDLFIEQSSFKRSAFPNNFNSQCSQRKHHTGGYAVPPFSKSGFKS